MTSHIPKTQKSWTVQGQDGFESLKLNEHANVPEVSDYEVLVKFHATSLNYRDLIIPKGGMRRANAYGFKVQEKLTQPKPVGTYPFAQKDGVVPGSDGAGTVVSVGKKVVRFKEGDKVLTLFNQQHLGGSLDTKTITSGVGGVIDGTLRQYGSYNENGLVSMPESLSFEEASTLPCAAVTAWNALNGIKSQALKSGDTILTQGTGGVSIFAVQFAKAAGAKVIATTSSSEKAEVLKKLGADHVINYKETAEWGEAARKLTYGGEGVDYVVEVGGPSTMEQSLKAVKIDGVISIVGFLGGNKAEKEPSFLEALNNVCTVRGVLVGSRVQFEEMNRAIEANKIKPVVDKKIFKLEETKEAYQYMWDQKHLGKLVVKIE